MKTKQEQIAEMAVIGCVRNPQAHTVEECLKCEFSDGCCNAYRHAETLYDAGYRKTFTGELASDTQKAFKEGYSKGVDYGIEFGKVLLYKTRKESVKEFAEKLKEKYGHYWCYLWKKDLKQLRTIIDELLKEYEE